MLVLTVKPKPDLGPELRSNQLLKLPDATISVLGNRCYTVQYMGTPVRRKVDIDYLIPSPRAEEQYKLA